MKATLEKIFTHDDLLREPPILVDIGASGGVHEKWRGIAKYSLCLAFDPDEREMHWEERQKGFKRLIVERSLVSDSSDTETPFYLTRFPYCSSTLKPDRKSLEPWHHRDLFDIQEVRSMPASRLSSALQRAQLSRVDWLKVDSQGTDLRLFQSLPKDVREGVLAAEFEPGIIDAYNGEDKLYNVLEFMDQADFYVSNMDVKGTHRLPREAFKMLPRWHQQQLLRCGKVAPGWAEVTFLAVLSEEGKAFTRRNCLLAYVFACIERQFGFAYEIAARASKSFADAIFVDLQQDALRRIRQRNMWAPIMLLRNVLNRLLRNA